MPAFHSPGSAGPFLDRVWARAGRPAVAAIAASAAGLLFIEVIVLIVWGADTGSSTGPGAAMRVGADLWLVAHGTTLGLSNGVISLRPLGLALFPLVAAMSAAHRRATAVPAWTGPLPGRPGGVLLGRTAAGRDGADVDDAVRGAAERPGEAAPSGRRPAPPSGVTWRAVVLDVVEVVAAQTAFVVLIALVVRSGPAQPAPLSAVTGTVVFALPAALLGALAGRHRLRAAWRTLPVWLRTPLLCGAGAFAALIAAVSFGVALVIAATLPEVAGAERALDVGVVGGLGLAAVQLALVPNLVLWALSYALGPGFRTGPGLVRADVVHPGTVPDLPVLAALPPNALPQPGWPLLLVVPIVAGIVCGIMVHRAGAAGRSRERLGAVLVAGTVCGILVGLACQESLGRVGGAGGHYGPVAAWQCGLLAGGEVALVGLLLVGGIDLAVRRAERPFLAQDAEPSFWRRRMTLPASRRTAWTSRRTD
ncbi:Integral membrane protein [Frankia sp. AgKG'84/4]